MVGKLEGMNNGVRGVRGVRGQESETERVGPLCVHCGSVVNLQPSQFPTPVCPLSFRLSLSLFINP